MMSDRNPYIGPRPYGRGEGNFFGREREGKELAWLILAERAVLFYAQSGAGKTSLLNARVIPTLEKRGVHILPVARVGSALPEGITPEQVDNIFAFSALLTLAAESALAPEALLKHTLLSYLQDYALQNPQSKIQNPSPTLLILDQFEEIATTHRDHWAEAEGFFHQVREAIDALPGLGVLFVLREDYVAELDPYTPLLPSHLQARFRMTLPTRAQAMEIVRGPAAQAGVPFAEEAAQNLVANLSRIKGRQREGGDRDREGAVGQYVEPVQLQVVCQQLWDSLPEAVAEDGVITWDEIAHYNVDDALTSFYENTLTTVRNGVFDKPPVSERQLRRWFTEQLITPEGRRGLALQGAAETASLPNAVVRELESHHLIRAESRGGSRWYELSHDRLVEPVVKSNRGWEAAQDQMHPWRPIARQWEAAQSETLLYRGKELEAAWAWLAAADLGDVEEYERAFIEASGEAERERKRKQRLYIIGSLIAAMLLMIMVGLTLWAMDSQSIAQEQRTTAVAESTISAQERATAIAAEATAVIAQATAEAALITAETERANAEQQAQTARSRQLAVQSTLKLESALDLASLLSIGAYGITTTAEARSSLLSSLQHNPQLRTFSHGHENRVWNVAFSPDGLTMASGSFDGTILLWDISDLRTPAQLGALRTGYTDSVTSVAFSPDGHILAAGGAYGTLILWDISNPRAPVQFGARRTGQTDSVYSVAFSSDAQILASGSGDGTLILWDVSDPRAPAQLSAPRTMHNDSVSRVTFSPDGQTLASVSSNGSILLWDVSDPRAPVPLDNPRTGHSDWISSVAFNPDGQILALGSGDGTLILLDVSDPRAPEQLGTPLIGHTDNVYSVAFSPDGQTLASGSGDKTVILWDVADPHAPAPRSTHLAGHMWGMYSVAFSPDGQTLAAGSCGQQGDWGDCTQGAILLWDVYPPRVAAQLGKPLTGHEAGVTGVAFSPDGQILASSSCGGPYWGACTQGEIILRDMGDPRTPVQLGSPLTGHTGGMESVAFSPDGQTLTAGSCGERDGLGQCTQGAILLWDVSDLYAPAQLGALRTGHTDDVSSVAFSPDGQTLAAGSRDWGSLVGTLLLWNVSNPRAPEQLGALLTKHKYGVNSMAFSPNGQTLASGSCGSAGYGCTRGEIFLWDVSDPRVPLSRSSTGTRDGSLAFSPDGQTLAAGGYQELILWDVSDPDAPVPLGAPLTGHSGWVSSMAFSPDGQTLVSDAGQGLILWDVSDPRAPMPLGAPLTGHRGVNGMAFSPDGQTLASGGGEGILILWDVNGVSWQARACQKAGRNLTWDEWRRYFSGEVYRKTCAEWPLHPSFIEAGQALARDGAIEAAIAFFTPTLTLYPERTRDPETEARLLVALGLVAQGQELARAGEMMTATAFFSQALRLDPALDLNPQKEAQRLRTPALIDKGRTLAETGEIVTATALFSQALRLDPGLGFDPEKEAQRLGTPALIKEGQPLAVEGKIEAALAVYAQAQMYGPDAIDIRAWNDLCWFGSIHGYATKVLFACEKAVELSPQDGDLLDSRGLARALTGNVAGAIEDFKAAVNDWQEQDTCSYSPCEQRQTWIAALEAGRNPFTPEVLAELRGE